MPNPSRIEAQLRLVPAGSQVFVVAIAALGGASLLISFLFIWLAVTQWYIPLVAGCLLIALASTAFWRSQRDIDQHGAPPTTIRDKVAGLEITADMRLFGPDGGKQLIAQIVTAMAYRRQLPEPDGLVGIDGKPVPGSLDTARARVQAVNDQITDGEQQVAKVLKTNRGDTDESPIAQLPTVRPPDASSLRSSNLPPQAVTNRGSDG